MDDFDRKSFGSYIVSLGELYSKEITSQFIEMYWRLLNQYPLEVIKMAFKEHAVDPERGQFFPKPADIIYIINNKPEVRMRIEGMCEFCNQAGMLIVNGSSSVNGKQLCFDHYMYFRHGEPSSPKLLAQDIGTEDEKELSAYDKMRKEMRREAYETLKRNFYSSQSGKN